MVLRSEMGSNHHWDNQRGHAIFVFLFDFFGLLMSILGRRAFSSYISTKDITSIRYLQPSILQPPTSILHPPQVREYKAPSSENGDLSTAQVDQMKRDVESKKTGLEQWSKTAFEEVNSLVWVDVLHEGGSPG